MLEPTALLLFIIGLLNVGTGLSAIYRDSTKLSNVFFASTAISLGGWVIGIAGFLLTNNPQTAFIWAKIYYFFPILVGISIIFFAEVFGQGNRLPKTFIYVFGIGFLAVVLPLLFVHGFVTEALVYHSWGKEITLNKIDYFIYSFYLLACLLGAEYIMLRKSHKMAGLYRIQARLFFYGFLVTGIFGVLFNLLFPWFGNYRLIWLGPLFTTFFVVAIFYNITKHRMFDIRAAIVRSLVYVLSSAFILAIYAFILFVIGAAVLNMNSVTFKQWVIIGALTLVIAATYQRIQSAFRKITNKIFYQDAYDPQNFIDQLNQAIVSDIRLKPLLKKSSEIIAENIKVDFVLFGLKSTEDLPEQVIGTTNEKVFRQEDIEFVRQITPHIGQKVIITDELEADHGKLKSELAKYGIGALARLTTDLHEGVEGIGYIVLGYKKSGNPYNSTDSRILEIISNELVIAIQNSMQFEEIQQFNITLQKRIKDATAELERTNKRLVALDEAKDEFISMASHQLRTPLTSVKGFISMILDGDFGKISPKQKEVLKEAFASSQRMVFLIADFLNVSRIKTGKFMIELTEVDLPEIVTQEIDQLRDMAQSRGLKIVYHAPAGFPKVMLDENKIRQVMMNFVDNAIYYTKKGGKIEIQLYATASEIIYKVIDSGIGVPKAEQHRLFTKFFRAKNAQQARPDGTGLGLFMAQKVIVAQGGSVIFESVEGKGSTFGFRFPLSKIRPKSPKPTPKG